MGSRGNLSHASTFLRVNTSIEPCVSPRRAVHGARSVRVKEGLGFFHTIRLFAGRRARHGAVFRTLTQVSMGSRMNLTHASTFRRVKASIEPCVNFLSTAKFDVCERSLRFLSHVSTKRRAPCKAFRRA